MREKLFSLHLNSLALEVFIDGVKYKTEEWDLDLDRADPIFCVLIGHIEKEWAISDKMVDNPHEIQIPVLGVRIKRAYLEALDMGFGNEETREMDRKENEKNIPSVNLRFTIGHLDQRPVDLKYLITEANK